jgi:hypothetical protein
MPYIEQDKRFFQQHNAAAPETPGELNFQITSTINAFMQEKGLRYQTINDILGALEGAKLEFYRRVAADYEDDKRIQNGEVYDVPKYR